MIGSFASGATAPRWLKIEFKLITPIPITETYFEINLSSTNASLVAKNGTKKYSTTMDKLITSTQILVFEVSKQLY